MSTSLSELRADPPKARVQTNYRVSLRGDLVAKVQQLTADLQDLDTKPEADADGNPTGPPRKSVEGGPDPRLDAIIDQLTELQPPIDAATGDLTLQAIDDGKWRRWVDDHPARGPETPQGKRDQATAGGVCDSDALLDALSDWVYAWNGDPLTAEDWENIFVASIAGGDKRIIARTIVGMQEGTTDLPKLLAGLLGGLRSVNG